MINEKLQLTKEILEDFENARGDGNGVFLNLVYLRVCGTELPDFTKFNTESWTRARRKIMEKHRELDNRTSRTKDAEEQVKAEMGYQI